MTMNIILHSEGETVSVRSNLGETFQLVEGFSGENNDEVTLIDHHK